MMPVTTASKPTLGVPQRPFRRSGSDCILGGVCGGLAIRLGVKERTIRVLFSLGAFIFGLGLVSYLALWLFLARSGEDHSIARRLSRRRREFGILLPLIIVVLIIILGVHSFGLFASGGFTWALLLSALGGAAIWRGASPDERLHLEALVSAAPVVGRASSRGWKGLLLRVVPGVILIVVGLHMLNNVGGVWGAAVPALLGAIVLVIGLLIALAPWWLQTVYDLSKERRERVRIEERAAMVTHIHDSVLQTLTLIERAAGNESDVVRLARAQERELRQWLFSPESVGTTNATSTSFVALVEAIQRDIENDYGVKVELVTVGDCPSDERSGALIAAAREAAINPAKRAGETTISIIAAVEPATLAMYVRDTGVGFDLGAVAADRQGIARSIRQRMTMAGGQAIVKTTVGSGTEVELLLPRQRP